MSLRSTLLLALISSVSTILAHPTHGGVCPSKHPESSPTHEDAIEEDRSGDLLNEVVYLMECNKYRTTGGTKVLFGAQDYYFYFKDDALVRSTGSSRDAWARAFDHIQHDGMVYHIDWTSGTESDPLTADLIPNRSWKVWGLEDAKGLNEGQVSTGKGKLGGEDMKCFGERGQLNFVGDWKEWECTKKYSCYRENRVIKRTELTVFDNEVQVSVCGSEGSHDYPELPAAYDSYGKLVDVLQKNKGEDTGFDIGGGCSIHWKVRETLKLGDEQYDPKVGERMNEMFQKLVAEKVQASMKTFDSCRDSSMFGQICKPCRGVTYPAEGLISIQVTDQVHKEWVPQTEFEFHVKCADKCSPGGEVLKAIADSTGLLATFSTVFDLSHFGTVVGLVGAAAGAASDC